MKFLITGATIVNEGKAKKASLIVEDETIKKIIPSNIIIKDTFDEVIDAQQSFLLPGIIDTHVHFREPGLTHKADIKSESRAAAYGGVTSYFDMPNTIPQTITKEALEEKYKIFQEKSYVNYSLLFGATNSNSHLIKELDMKKVPAVKLFMGSSTGNMLVDKKEALGALFSSCHLPIMVHAEDSQIIDKQMAKAKALYGEDPDIIHHPEIRSQEACLKATSLAIKEAKKYGAQLHVAHISTLKELELLKCIDPKKDRITYEATVSHLYFSQEDYPKLGALIKCNPAIKTLKDRDALRRALKDGRITTIATDHAPHEYSEKIGGCSRAASGIPMIQFSLCLMLELVDEGILSIERLVELMCHNPSKLFKINKRGFIKEGYKADLVIVKPNSSWKLTEDIIQSKSKWSPLLGHTFSWKVIDTFVNGHHIYNDGKFDATIRGERIEFKKG